MKVMVMVKATPESEAGVMPTEAEIAAMGAFNEQLVNAGVMLAGEGLQPSTKGARVRFDAAGSSVIDGPFAETRELLAGFWLWQVRSMDEAIEWLKRAPFNADGSQPVEVEIRPFMQDEDFGDAFTPELRAQEQRLRERISGNE